MSSVIIAEELGSSFDQNRSSRIRRSSVPNQGTSLEAVISLKGKPLREAVATMAAAFSECKLSADFQIIFAPRYLAPGLPYISPERIAHRTAWNLACIWLLHRHAVDGGGSLIEAEDWFRASTLFPTARLSEALSSETRRLVEQHLGTLVLDTDFWNLFPYLLEEHGIGSRASVMRDPGTAQAREAKRKDGVFYTPSDVAEYMVRQVLQGSVGTVRDQLCLDPASGTGVFLLALLHVATAQVQADFDCFEYASNHLHGLDVSGHALDACAFVLLRACWHDAERRGLSPWAAWHRLRMNLVQVDALTIQPWHENEGSSTAKARFSTISDALTAPGTAFVEPELSREVKFIKPIGLFNQVGLHLQDVFPMVSGGFNVLVGNPPYAALGAREDMAELASSFRSLPESSDLSKANLFPLFIEMMWRFTSSGNMAAALVTPLSIAYHSGAQYENCRRAMSSAGGRWQFAFFDREPHALFGEEVKTRNAIILRREGVDTSPRGQTAEIETGPLRKWTSRTRHTLFDSIQFTGLGTTSITRGIPKLASERQATIFRALQRNTARLPALCRRINTCRPQSAIGAQDTPRVFVGPTAYNFLNVYRFSDLPESERAVPLTESAVHCLDFRSEQEAEAGFAIISSRLAFWLWHALGDGFHVTASLWQEIPFSRTSFDPSEFETLSEMGRRLWRRLQEHRFTSLNGGKLTIGYRPLHCNEERDAIDALLLRAAGLPDEFFCELQSFVRNNAVVDATDKRRQHLNA